MAQAKKKKDVERNVLFRVDIIKDLNGNITYTSIDNYARYAKLLPRTSSGSPLKEKILRQQDLPQKIVEENSPTKTRAEIVQLLVDSFDFSYRKAASCYEKYKGGN